MLVPGVSGARCLKSLPARGVWIEITIARCTINGIESHSPQGECGLKLKAIDGRKADKVSLPARGVWIEIRCSECKLHPHSSLPARGVWIEMVSLHGRRKSRSRHSPQGECGLKSLSEQEKNQIKESLPARGVWIEIKSTLQVFDGYNVTPRKGSVD